MILTLNRIDDETVGVLSIGSKASYLTLEPPPTKRIPEGIYICQRHVSPKFGETFKLLDVPGRTHIMFHVGNFVSDSDGCILLGRMLSDSAISYSKRAMKGFMGALLNVDVFALQIKNRVA